MNTVSHKYRQSALLLLTAAIWGSAFVAQQTGMDYVGPFTFNAARNLLGGLTLLPLIVFFLLALKSEPYRQMLRQKMAHSQKHSGRAVFSAASHCLSPQPCSRSASSTQPSERPVLSPHFTSSLFRSAACSSENEYNRRSGSQFSLPLPVSICSA